MYSPFHAIDTDPEMLSNRSRARVRVYISISRAPHMVYIIIGMLILLMATWYAHHLVVYTTADGMLCSTCCLSMHTEYHTSWQYLALSTDADDDSIYTVHSSPSIIHIEYLLSLHHYTCCCYSSHHMSCV